MGMLRTPLLLLTVGLYGVPLLHAQIDPVRRELIQLGYNQPLEGRSPLAAYAYLYLNHPYTNNHTNLTLRLAIAPVYVDSELGIRGVLGPQTDLGLGLAGGGFAESYHEIRMGKYVREESFDGHSAEVGVSLYHLFNPASLIPLSGLVRGALHGVDFESDDRTASNFQLPNDEFSYRVRSGLRWGGREPLMLPALAMEVSGWYEGQFRWKPGSYGFNGDREVRPASHLFWGRGLLTYTIPTWEHNFGINVTGGMGLNVDRLSAYRLGGNLPLYSEFPLTLPGYYFQELTARSFALLGGSYSIPLDHPHRWSINALGATAWVDYLPGLEQPNHWNTGAGGALIYRSPTDTWQVAVGYGYGFDAIRTHGRGAQSVSFIMQFDLGATRHRFFDPSVNLNQTRGLQHIMQSIFR